jgi:hypothetical protein
MLVEVRELIYLQNKSTLWSRKMAEIKLVQLDDSQMPEKVVDLKTELKQGNLEAMTAFKTLRGGAMATAKWSCSLA